MIRRDAKTFVAGHQGLVGSAIVRRLNVAGFSRILTRTRSEVDLTRQESVEELFAAERPAQVFLAAAKVGGIRANARQPGDFIRDNLQIQVNVLEAARQSGVEKLLFLGSSCIYPRLAPQPMAEDAFMTGSLEPTNSAYAVAKIAGIEMCEAYRRQYGCNFVSLMPTNLYGPGDNFDPEESHVVPALIRRFHEAKLTGSPAVRVWGTGTPRREFLHVDDLADAALFVMDRYDGPGFLNVGVGHDVTIARLAEMIGDAVGYEGLIEFDASKPDGTPRKLLDVSRLTQLGWRASIGLEEGIAKTVAWYRRHHGAVDHRTGRST